MSYPISRTTLAAAAVSLLALAAGIASIARAGEPAPAARPPKWVELSGGTVTGQTFVRLDAVDVLRVSQTSASRAEAFTVSAGKLKHTGIIKDAPLDRIRPSLTEWIKVGNDGLLVNPRRITMVRFDPSVSATGRRATVHVTDLFEVGTATEADDLAKLERLLGQ